MTKTFKIGDIVEANEASNGVYEYTTLSNGWRGKVTRVDESSFTAETVEGKDSHAGQKYSVLFPRCFDLVTSNATKQSIEIIEGLTVELTAEQLEEVSRKLQSAADKAKKVPEPKVKIGDWIRAIGDGEGITDGKAYEVFDNTTPGFARVVDDFGNKTGVPYDDFKIIEKPTLKVGDWIRINDYEGRVDISANPYKITEIDADGDGIFYDDANDPRNTCGKDFEIIDKLTPFDRAGRAPNEFKDGDIVRVTDGGYEEIREGDIGEVTGADGSRLPLVRVGNHEYYVPCELVTPVESRVDIAEGGERA